MSSNHTPFPWGISKDKEGLYNILSSGEIVAFGVSPRNANLVAASPALLQAAKRALSIIKGLDVKYMVTINALEDAIGHAEDTI